MKKIIFIIIAVVFITLAGKSQGLTGAFINFPDSNFLKALIKVGVDKDNNGKIDTIEAKLINKLNFNNIVSNIQDLMGIEYFLNLTILDCSWNDINNLNISKNINLIELYCSQNQLKSLDVTKNINLEYLFCGHNLFTNLDVSQNISLTHLECIGNKLINLDVSKQINLTYLNCSNTQLTNLDITKNINLTSLAFDNNPINNIDLTKNIYLTTLRCGFNDLSNLDISKNINLSILLCPYSKFKSLDVSNNINLSIFYCSYNQLTYLDISNCTKITDLHINNNPNLQNVCVWTLPFPTKDFILFEDTLCASYLKYDTLCNGLNIEEKGATTLNIFPNPANNFININSTEDIKEIRVYNILGEIVNSPFEGGKGDVASTSSVTTSINVANLPPNIYIIECITKNKIYKNKFIKE
jgi:Leucine-rich repeat (LRR) protein